VDVRGFSGLAERLAPATTYALMAELLDALTVAVHGTGGVVVDYYGDGLEAMWNAPNPQPDHARRACATALEMHRAVAEIAAAWAARVGGAVRVGVGIHTGRALVGNAGSRTRVKYGPRGAAVNLASRVEGATKELGVATLLTADTVARAGADLSVRPVGTVALRGLAEPVALFELLDASGGAAPVDG
jgi:adenylate cyclase